MRLVNSSGRPIHHYIIGSLLYAFIPIAFPIFLLSSFKVRPVGGWYYPLIDDH